MIVHDVIQRSDEWRALRCGRLCGSRANDMMAAIQKGEAAARRNLRAQLVLERITGKPQERGYQSQAMLDGIEREADAADLYELLTGKLLRAVGFVAHDELMAGCSPDGVIGDFEGLVEAKCPIPATHLEYLKTGIVPLEYQRQITHNLWITGAAWCDWFSFHPDFPESLRSQGVRVVRVEAEIAAYEMKARAFLAEVDQELAALSTLRDLRATLKASAA